MADPAVPEVVVVAPVRARAGSDTCEGGLLLDLNMLLGPFSFSMIALCEMFITRRLVLTSTST